MNKDNLLSVAEYAKQATNTKTGKKGVTTNTVYRWLKEGIIKGEKISNIQFVIVDE